jgi:carboxyl-terminal processing protease
MQNNKLKTWLPFYISLAMIAGMFIGYKIKDNIPGKGFFGLEKPNYLKEVIDLIDSRYVDTVQLSPLADSAILSILNNLDPHSAYIPAQELEDVNNDINGSFVGIGVEFEFYDDTVNVTRIIEKGPAATSGLQKDDQIIKVNNRKITGKSLNTDSIRSIIRGVPNTKIKLDIIRANKPISLTITRNVVPVNSVDASYMVDSITGYMKIARFSSNTYSDFMLALLDLKKKGLQQLILDLRNNGGGVLDEAVEIADEFLEGDKLITYTEGRKSPKKEYRCRRTGQFEKGKLVLLTNDGSASASEILAGSLQEWGRATIIGNRTFGKGLVQEQYDLSNGAALRLTIARYYTPSGRCIQRPYSNGIQAYYDEVLNPEKITDTKIDSSKAFKTPTGKLVYDGGGISPDLTPKNDSSLLDEASTLLMESGTLSRFAYHFYKYNHQQMMSWKDAYSFFDQFHLSQKDWNELQQFAKSDSLPIKNFSLQAIPFSEEYVKMAFIRYRWGNTFYTACANKKDNCFKLATSFLNKK